MGRGKDGYKSLLVQPEGGVCEEVVSEENGMLISAILRQYFMSLKVMNQWKNWGPSLARHWGQVASDVGKSHPIFGSQPGSVLPSPVREKSWAGAALERKNSWTEWTPAKLREKRGSMEPSGDSDSDSDEEEQGDDEEDARQEVRNIDRELDVMRRTFRKWCRLAGVKGQVCDSLKENEVQQEVAWTKAIAPQVEGRIQIVGGEDNS